jgi:hypothetical protein
MVVTTRTKGSFSEKSITFEAATVIMDKNIWESKP